MQIGENEEDDTNKLVLGYEWGRQPKGEPIPRPNGIALASRDEGFSAGEITDCEEVGETRIVLTSSGKLYTAGSNECGLLGLVEIPTTQHIDELSLVSVSGKSVSEISVGRHHVLALTSDGKVYAWGSNSCGQVGKYDEKGAAEPPPPAEKSSPTRQVPQKETPVAKERIVPTPTVVGFETALVCIQVLAVENSSYALDGKGRVWSWGRKEYIGRLVGDVLDKDEDGRFVKFPDNNLPRQVPVLDAQGREVWVRKLLRKGRKVVALVGAPDEKPSEPKSSVKGEENKSKAEGSEDEDNKEAKDVTVPPRSPVPKMEAKALGHAHSISSPSKHLSPEEEQIDYDKIKGLVNECKVRVLQKLTAFENTLQIKADEYRGFAENPLGGLLRGESRPRGGEPLDREEAMTIHIDLKAGIKTMESIMAEFDTIKKAYYDPVKEVDKEGENHYATIVDFVIKLIEDVIRLKKLLLLAFKLHSYHLKLKHKNILAVAASYLGSSEKVSLSALLNKLTAILAECEYVTRRFSNLKGEFNKLYDDRVDSAVSRAAYHMLDTTYSECEAWKYVNMVCRYALLYQTGYEDLISVANKMERMHELHEQLRKGDPNRIYQESEASADPEKKRKLLDDGCARVASANEDVKGAINDICTEGLGGDGLHKKILTYAYEVLVDTSTLRIAYYDLFLSFYNDLNSRQKSLK